MQIVESGQTKEKREVLKKHIRDLIMFDELQKQSHESWRPLQETMANSYLLKVQNQTDDSELRKIINLLVWKTDSVNVTINKLTKTCQFIMENLGYEKGWNLLSSMSFIASSPNLIQFNEKPKNQKDLIRMKKEGFDKDFKIGQSDPYLVDPTGRFIEMITVISRNIDITKKSLERGLDASSLAGNVALMCGHEIKIIPDQIEILSNHLKLISENSDVIPSESRRIIHSEASKFMGFFKEIAKQDYPISWFVTDVRNGKIHTANHPMLKDNKEIFEYIHENILKYQFLKSIKTGKNLINCFDKNLAYCKNNCEECGIYKSLKISRDLFKIASDFSYDELRNEAMNKKEWRERATK